ncbi:MAG TPA: SUMF1/EgtB/PvdO family nonheme iron enzyme [Myxococcaceae bacterium]|nr:SUMF1/EgtB/PvdO family nonheme iron enzyme [Myxococcaceae bacterium]
MRWSAVVVVLALACATRVTVTGGKVELDEARVEVDPFEVDQRAATAEEYARCAAAHACQPIATDDPLCAVRDPEEPAKCLRWTDAAAYCAWRSARLPTDAERSLLDRSAKGEPHAQLMCREPGRDNPFGLCDLGGPVETWTTNAAFDGPSERASSTPEDRTPTLGARCVHSAALPRPTGVPRKLQTGVRIIQVKPPN